LAENVVIGKQKFIAGLYLTWYTVNTSFLPLAPFKP